MAVPLKNTATRYGLISQLLHWSVVVLIALQYTWAWRIDQTEGLRARFELVVQHKSMGMTVLGLVVLRLLWRLFNRPPPLPPAMRRWEITLAGLTHWLLYALILAMPLTGWMYSSASGYGAEFYGLLNIPDFVPESERLADIMGAVHGMLAIALAATVVLHVLAALRHHFWLKDDILKRMLPLWK